MAPRFVRRFLLLALLQAGLAGSAHAQITFDGCVDARGIPVASIVQYGLGDVARAGLAPDGSPVILYDPSVLVWFAPATRLWWYGHECGHHALGHNFGTAHPLAVEQQADCFGIRALIDAGALSPSDLPVIQADLRKLGPGDWTHLPGPRRAFNLPACLGSPSPPRPAAGPLMCCDPAGRPWCAIHTNPGPVGSPCWCAGVPGVGRMCR